MDLMNEWRTAKDTASPRRVWHKMLAIHADQVFTIGLIAGMLQPVVVRTTLRNVPDEGIYNWDPGAHFGIYRPDTFWFAQQELIAHGSGRDDGSPCWAISSDGS